jgi:hypothetical protein
MTAGPVLYRMRAELAPALGEIGPLEGLTDWPSAVGYLLGRATAAVTRAGDAIARMLSDRLSRPGPAKKTIGPGA